MYTIVYERPARVWLEKLARKNPALTAGIVKKIDWLAENADHLDHEKMKGHTELSLHFGGYRILYLLDRLKQIVTVCFIDHHDKAYQRLRRRK
jgi:mRNA-degrading endonuclease RelE of RelBE toxin-antitoxin system